MDVKYNFVVDLARPSKTNTMLVSQGDSNSRTAMFTLMNDGRQFDLSEAIAAYVTAKTVTGKTIVDAANCTIVTEEKDGKTVKTNRITYTLPAQITEMSGRTILTITIQAVNSILTTFEFYVDTRNELYAENNYSDEDDLSGFHDLLNRALSAVQKVETLTGNSALPNPYPLRLTIGSSKYEYNGAKTVEVTLTEFPFFGSYSKSTSQITLK
jgi:hypothetical protein